MATYEHTFKYNLQDGSDTEFEQIKREVLAKVNLDGCRCMVTRHGKPEIVNFAGFEMTPEGKILVAFCRISEFLVKKEHCEPSGVHLMSNEPYEWPEDRLAKFGYSISGMRRVE